MNKPAKKYNFQFRPSADSAYMMRRHGNHASSSWWRRFPSPHDKAPLNQRTLGGIFMILHHMGSHAPAAVERKWHAAEQRFIAHHMPHCKSCRFANKFTAHRWL